MRCYLAILLFIIGQTLRYTYRVLIAKLLSFVKDALADGAGVLGSKEGFKAFFRVPLYRNALYLMTANIVNAFLGFVFWIIVARLYAAEDVGLASAAISGVMLMVSFSHLGLGTGLIRFLPRSSKNANSMINTCFTISTFISILVAVIFIAGLGSWSPNLLFIRQNPVYLAAFVAFAIAATLSILVDATFIAQRRAGFIVAKNLIFNLLKLALPILLAVFFHSFGIFASWGVSLGIALLVSLFLFLPRAQPGYYPIFALRKKVVNEMLPFSFANYISMLLWAAPVYILPIMVVSLLGAEANAYFYIAWAIANLLFMLPSAVSRSLFAEGSYDEEKLGSNTWRSLRLIFLILVPLVILILAFADKLLLLFGGAYSESATILLRIMALSALPLAINVVYLAIKRVQMRLKLIIGLTAFVAVVTLGLSYLLLPRMGINGAGIAWLISQGVVALGIIANSLWRRRR